MEDAGSLPSGLPGVVLSSITIGVELEFVLCNLPDGMSVHEDPHRNNTNTTFELIHRALVPVEDMFESSIAEKGPVFDVQGDESINAHGQGNRGGVEVATPILSNRSWTWVIPEMCEAIIKGSKDVGTSVEVNDSTGLHVHIGIGRSYTLDELKRVAQAVVIFEKAMDVHHPIGRNGTPPEDDTNYITSCRESPPLDGMTTTQMVQRLKGLTTYSALRGVTNGAPDPDSHWMQNQASRYFKYNFDAVRKYGTIEFRQAAGTIDPVWIVEWIECVIRFVTSAIDTPEEIFAQWARNDEAPTDLRIVYKFGLPAPEGGFLDIGKLSLDSETEDDRDSDSSDDVDYGPRRRKRDALKRVARKVRDVLRTVRQSEDKGGEGYQGER